MKILLVDDDSSILRALGAMLERDGHEVIQITNPLRAAGETEWDLVISDYSMPSLDGVALLRRLAVSVPTGRRFLMTAHDHVEPVRHALRDGLAEQVFPKPWRFSEIRSAIARRL